MSVPELNFPKTGKMVLVGAEGSGKTTFLRCLLGLTQGDGGEVAFYQGETRKEFLGHTGVVLGNGTLPLHLSPKQVQRIFGAQYSNWSRSLFAEILEALELSFVEPLETKARGRECLFACALAHEPDLLVIDRPSHQEFYPVEGKGQQTGLEGSLETEGSVWEELEQKCLSLLPRFYRGGSQIQTRHSVEDLPAGVTHLGFFHQGDLRLYGERKRLLQECGTALCSLEELQSISGEDYVSGVETEEGYLLLLSDRVDFFMKYPKFPMKDVSVSEIFDILEHGENYQFIQEVAL